MSVCDVIGIDLGTTYSCVGVYKNGRVEIIANREGSRITPSVVGFENGGRLIGAPAKMRSARNPANTIFGVKRMIGRKFNDVEIQKDIELLPYSVVEEHGNPMIELNQNEKGRKFPPEQISGFVLSKMKETAETYIGKCVKNAVITVPAYFNDGQRQATKDAAIIAGFEQVKMINEPTAAAIAYGLENVIEGSKTVLVFDLGGGTFDVSIVEVGRNYKFDVIVTAGDTHLGGDDFDKIILKRFVDEFEKKHLLKISDNSKALSKLRSASEKAKIDLSTSATACVEIDALMNGIDFTSELTKARFDDLCDDLFQKTIETVEMALKHAQLEKWEIDDVVLVGGSTRIPKVQQLLSEYFENKELKHSVNPDEAVAYGAAIYAAKCFDVKDSKIEQLRLTDVTPLSLGIVTEGDVMSTIIKRGTQIPTEATGNFCTVKDNQTEILRQVYEGERSIASENHKLGEFRICGIPPLSSREGKVSCTMKIDSDGILTVTGVVIANGNTNSLTISSDKGRLSKIEIEKMIREAEKYEELDRQHLKRAAARNELDKYACSVESSLKRNADRISSEDVEKLTNACEESIEWRSPRNSLTSEEIGEKHSKLREISRRFKLPKCCKCALFHFQTHRGA